MFPSENTTLDQTLAKQFIFNIDGYHCSKNEVANYSANQPLVIDSTKPEFSKFLIVCNIWITQLQNQLVAIDSIRPELSGPVELAITWQSCFEGSLVFSGHFDLH